MSIHSARVLARHRGRLVFLCGALLLALAATLTVLKHWWRPGEPGVHFAATEHDFGKIPSDGVFTYEFPFRNGSGKPVTIARVHSSCGCVADDSAHQPIPDGGTGSVQVTLTTNGIRPPQTLAKRLLVVFEQPEVEPVALVLRGKVCPEVSCEPNTVQLKESSFGNKVSADLIIHREMLPPDEFASVLVEAPRAYCEIKDLSRTADKYHVQVELIAEGAPRTPSPLRVQYRKSGKNAHLVVPVVFEAQEHAQLIPPSYVQAVRNSTCPDELAERTTVKFVLTSRGHPHIRVLEIVPEKPEDARFFRWRIDPGAPSFDVCLCECPPAQGSVYSTAFSVLSGDGAGGRQRLRLEARVVVTDTK